MCDFLISFSPNRRGKDLLSVLKMPYGGARPEGCSFDFAWGSVAVLQEPLAGGKSVVEKEGQVVAWVGDLVTEMTDAYIDALLERVALVRGQTGGKNVSLEADDVFAQLNGAFAILCADEKGVCIIPDIVASVAVHAGYDKEGRLRALGTHQDLVAVLTGEPLQVDRVSIAEFFDRARISFPYTMHERVKRLDPGCAHWFRCDGKRQVERETVSYWRPPSELMDYDERELVCELRTTLVEAVQKRCRGERIGVSLSGGLDSRLVMAIVPQSVECIGLTFCDTMNRETKTAAKVAQCYGRQWVPLFRDPEHVANMTEAAIRFIGCEGFFLDTHIIGLSEAISRCRVDRVLSGLKMDTYLRCYYAYDVVRVARLAGLLPPRYVQRHFDFAGNVAGFWASVLEEPVLAGLRERRERFMERYGDTGRTSQVDWLTVYPVFSGIEGWPAERRVLGIVAPALDRKLIEFSFKCPLILKAGGRVYMKAAKGLYGPGCRIANANDGVRPGSGHWSRLAQRTVRKSHDRVDRALEKLGKEPSIEHSWHDYQKYWRESPKVAELRDKYGANLDGWDGVLLKKKGRTLLEDRHLPWKPGFRLLQLAVWLGVMKEHAAAVHGKPTGDDAATISAH